MCGRGGAGKTRYVRIRFFAITSIASLLLCAATAVLWAERHEASLDIMTLVESRDTWEIIKTRNRTYFVTSDETGVSVWFQTPPRLGPPFSVTYDEQTLLRIGYANSVLSLLTLAVLNLCVWMMVGRKRHVGHCATCSYDLTGNTSGTCPECGTAVAGKAGT